jgi:uncharacterized protein DUF3238
MDRTPQRLVVALAIVLLAFAGNAGAAAAGGGVTTDLSDAGDPPLAQADTLTLHSGGGGDIQAVVYQGNEQARPSVVTALSGFTAPTGALRAKTTYIVADGQTGVHSGGTDTLSFTAGGGSLNDGPDAFPGGDPCPWGPPSCLWDTRTFDVSAQVAPGDTTATAQINGTPDCINHEAQVFAVGPAGAWATAGYVAAGVGLRNQGSGVVSIAGIPSGATVKKAILFWNVLASADPGGAMSVDGQALPAQLIGPGPDPCWGATSWAYRADVTSAVTGNGAYTLTGFPTGSASGGDPWDNGSPEPMMEGATLVVFYEGSAEYKVSFSTFIPTNYLSGPPQSFCIVPPQLWPPVIHGPQHLVFAGDDRGFDANATSFRTRQTVGLVSEQSASSSGVGTPAVEAVGESKAYAPDALAGDDRIDPADDDATLGDCHLLHARGTASTSNMHIDVTRVNGHQVKAHLYGGAGNPLVAGAPAIDWDLTLTIDTSGATPHWTLTGAHDGFPAYEVYVNGQTLYTYSPGPGPYGFGDILKLFPPLDVNVNASGDLH